jgi:carbon-monoxide dehydrogenase medium subunit
MYSVSYRRAGTIAEAVQLLGGEARALSGGMTLIPTMKTRLAAPPVVVDLMHVPALKGIMVTGRRVTIAAATTHAEVASSKEVASVCPALCRLASHIGDPHVRHRGTIGGSVANNDPAADYPAALLALGATVVTNKRKLPAAEFFSGLYETALEEGEIIVKVSFPVASRAGYAKFRNPASRYALVGVFVAKRGSEIAVAVTGAGEGGVFRWPEAEAALKARFAPKSLDGLKHTAKGINSDLHADAEYRAHLIGVMTKQAVAQATGK